MQKKAVIFDMDGVLIDSEPFWQQAQIDVLKDLGVEITQKECEETMGLRIDALVAHWYAKYRWEGPGIEETASTIVGRVASNVMLSGVAKEGVLDALKVVSDQGFAIGLATSSPMELVNAVLARLEISHYFSICHSAEFEEYGKPHPAVYLQTAVQMGVHPKECIAIEDSFNGLLAAKAATMKTIVIPEPVHATNPRFSIADIHLSSLKELTTNHLA